VLEASWAMRMQGWKSSPKNAGSGRCFVVY